MRDGNVKRLASPAWQVAGKVLPGAWLQAKKKSHASSGTWLRLKASHVRFSQIRRPAASALGSVDRRLTVSGPWQTWIWLLHAAALLKGWFPASPQCGHCSSFALLLSWKWDWCTQCPHATSDSDALALQVEGIDSICD